ncbi:MAG: Ni/Fe hydrogenase [Arcobacter sp.]|uniref:nickel-dependent hydrogenase large subunit n=1 Tax=uncultured Arcobacter sp. TaxID=165434 RepID=UPI000CB93538|nr:nickel-dependent hydrogenase large subunit [uncultured Arcobacter sp.]PLY08966.1 MAG: Ni/Fe hydrogenase [Arcobacter sp.]
MKTVDIIERIEGEAKLSLTWRNEKVSDASIDFLNFRGFEYILENKPILDALVYTPRICGICGQAHLLATVNAIENLYKNAGIELEITNKAKILRELGLIIEIIDSHIKWFYMFIMPDVVNQSKKQYSGYTPIKGEKWLEAQKAASETIKALAIYAGQWPHTSYMVPGGVVSDPTLLDIVTCENYLDQTIKYFEKSIAGISIENYLSLKRFEEIDTISSSLRDFSEIAFETKLEQVGKSHNSHIVLGNMLDMEPGIHKHRISRKIDMDKIVEHDEYTFKVNSKNDRKAHTWSKSVQYNNEFYEVGPLSRAIINKREFIKDIHKKYDDSVFTRVMARVDEIAHLLVYSKKLISQLDISQESYIKPTVDLKSLDDISATSTVEACRGSLLHNITVKKGLIAKYDVITPTVWNLSPKHNKELGVAQKAIIGSKSLEEATIILRSFDVCSVCTTH